VGPCARAQGPQGQPDASHLRHRPGERFPDSRTGNLVLGRVVEAITGTRHERWLDAELLVSLGMTCWASGVCAGTVRSCTSCRLPDPTGCRFSSSWV